MESVTTDVGVFGAGSPYEGQRVTHRGSQFVIEGSGPVDAIALVAWADAGQLTWTSAEVGQWVQSSAAPGSVPPPPTPPPLPTGETEGEPAERGRPSRAVVTAIVVLLLALGAVGAYLIGNNSSRTATTTTTGPISTEPASSTSSPETVTTTQSTTAPSTSPPTPAPTIAPTVAPTQPPAPADPVNNANFARIQIGMTLAQVEAILGGPGRLTDESSTFGDQYVWERTDGGYGNISISIKDGVVYSKSSSIA